MDDKSKEELFNSTEIKIEDIKKSDKSDEWDIVSEFEVDNYPTPYISVPKMREVDEESAIGISIKNDGQGDRDMPDSFKQSRVNEKSKKMKEPMQGETSSSKQAQEIERVGLEMEEAMQEQSYQHEQELGIKMIEREIQEAMQEKLPRDKQKLENERIKREMEEAMQEESNREQEKLDSKKVLKEIEEAMKEKLLGNEKTQENKTVVRKVEEAMQEKPLQVEQKREKEAIISKIAEAIQEISHDKSVGKNESLQCHGQPSELKSEKNSSIGNIETAEQFKLPAFCPEELSQDEKMSLEVEEAMNDTIAISSASRFSKSHIHAAKCESLSKKKNQNPTFQKDFPKVFEEICEHEINEQAKTSSEVDELVREIDSQVKICSSYLVSFRNEESATSSSNEEIEVVKESNNKVKSD